MKLSGINYKTFKKQIISRPYLKKLDILFRYVFSIIPLLHVYLTRLFREPDRPSNFILFVNGGIGDCAMVIPLAVKLNKYSNVIVIIPSHSEALFSIYAPKVKTFVYNGPMGVSNLVFSIRRLVSRNSVFVFTSSIAEIYAFYLAIGAPKAYGLIGNNKYLRSIGLGLRSKVTPSLPKVEIFLEIGITLINVFYGIAESTQISQLTPSSSPRGSYVVISPSKTTEWPAGRWQPDRFSSLADYLIMNFGLKIVFVGGEKDISSVDKIIKNCRHSAFIENLCGATSLVDLSELLSKAALVVSNDSGIMHMAALAATPCIAIFSFSDPNVYSWQGYTYAVFNKEYSCMPCVSFGEAPVDNYPFECPYDSRCDKVIQIQDVVDCINSLRKEGSVKF